MSKFHILTGDALAETFSRTNLDGEIMVAREALIDGPVSAADPETFWQQRRDFIQSSFDIPADEYDNRSRSEFEKINNINPGDEVNLWFENDLFCQANMWFTISLLNRRGCKNVYRVSPLVLNNSKWEGFGHHTPEDLERCYSRHSHFTKGDFKLGENLWEAFRNIDVVALNALSGSLSPCFPHLEEVCRAEMERKRNARPRKVLEDLLAQGYTEFNDIFKQFSQREGIYGYGDLQVNNMLKEISNL